MTTDSRKTVHPAFARAAVEDPTGTRIVGSGPRQWGAGREALVPAPEARTSFPFPVSVEHKDRPRSGSGARFRRMNLLGLLMILPPRIKRHSTVVFFQGR